MAQNLSGKPPMRGRFARRYGRWLGFPRSRRFITDYLRFAARIPSQALVRSCNLDELSQLRRVGDHGVGWCALFVRAFAILGTRHSSLRQTVHCWPWLRLHEHPRQIARVAVSCFCENEEWLNFAKLESPDELDLAEIQQILGDAKTRPLETSVLFWIQLRLARLPLPLRRMAWWFVLTFSASVRTEMVGTFGVTSVANQGAVCVHPPSLGQMVISYGPVDETGDVQITFVYDHRLFDGGTVAGFMREYEQILNTEVVAELESVQQSCGTRELRM